MCLLSTMKRPSIERAATNPLSREPETEQKLARPTSGAPIGIAREEVTRTANYWFCLFTSRRSCKGADLERALICWLIMMDMCQLEEGINLFVIITVSDPVRQSASRSNGWLVITKRATKKVAALLVHQVHAVDTVSCP